MDSIRGGERGNEMVNGNVTFALKLFDIKSTQIDCHQVIIISFGQIAVMRPTTVPTVEQIDETECN